MARLYTRADSPFFYIEYRVITGELRRESTRFIKSTRDGQRQAGRLLNEKAAAERSLAGILPESAFAKWVVPFLKQHCVNSKATLGIYLNRWNTLAAFFRLNKIMFPRQLAYAHAHEFIAWRVGGGDGRIVAHNTAKDELDTLRMIMNEAVRRDFCESNPCLRLRIKAGPRRERKEVSEADLIRIRKELQSGKWPEWMRVQFEIAIHTGRRISETRIAMKDVDLRRGEYLVRVKGGAVRAKPIHPALLPMLRKIKGEFTHDAPRSGNSAVKWREFFDSLGMHDYSFHCFRITFISRARRAGIDRWTLMQVVDHATCAIHSHYNKYSDADLRSAVAKVKFPTAPRKSSKRPRR